MAKRSSAGAAAPFNAPLKPVALIDEGLDALNLGFAIFDQNLKLVASNKSFSELRGFPVELLQPGTDIIELYRFNAGAATMDPAMPKRRLCRGLSVCANGSHTSLSTNLPTAASSISGTVRP